MQNTVFSEKFGSQTPWRQASGLHSMFYSRWFSLTRRLKESRFLPNSTAGLCTSDCGTTRQVCRAGGSPHSSWVQDRWEGKQLLRYLLQPGSRSIHSSPSCKALAGSKHFKKSLPSLFVPQKSANLFSLLPLTRNSRGIDSYNLEWKPNIISSGVIVSHDYWHTF